MPFPLSHRVSSDAIHFTAVAPALQSAPRGGPLRASPGLSTRTVAAAQGPVPTVGVGRIPGGERNASPDRCYYAVIRGHRPKIFWFGLPSLAGRRSVTARNARGV